MADLQPDFQPDLQQDLQPDSDSDPDIVTPLSPTTSDRSLSRARSIFARRSSVMSPEEQRDIATGIRYIQLNDHSTNLSRKFISNRLRSAKYTPLNMIPKALFEQFRRVSNFYFLIIACVSFIPGVSPTTPLANIFPLFIVVGFGFARDVFEDIKRSIEDARQNGEKRIIMARSPDNDPKVTKGLSTVSSSDAHALSSLKLDPDLHRSVASRDIAVGDIVLVRKGQVFPCDIVLLHSSGEGGVAYVSTANLDGESNLKRLTVAPPTGDLTSPSQLRGLVGKLRAQKPSTALHEFEASITLDGQETVPLDASNLMLRGSILRNTDYIYGIAAYTGFDSKVALNMRHPPSKMGSMERMLNRVVIFLFFVLFTIVVLASIASGVVQERDGAGQWYMGTNANRSGVDVGFRGLGTFLILFSTFIPVSLFVTLEFIRVLQALFMAADYRMKTGGQSVVARATNLNEMLGEVEHILSDKTGTLTENIMRYIACSAGGNIYNILKEDRVMERAIEQGVAPVRQLVLSMALCHSVVPEPKSEDSGNDDGKSGKNGKKKSKKAKKAGGSKGSSSTGVEIVHEGALDPTNGSDNDTVSINDLPEYQGQSPDEVALVTSAREYGIALLKRTLDTLVIDHLGTVETYTTLAELEFNSDRKRMSMILRCPDGKLRMFTKGADTIMLPLLEDGTDLETIQAHIDEFATEGLRTLVFAMRELQEDYFQEWFSRFQEARSSLEDREEKVSTVSAELELQLTYVATTAVEDKLQDKVPETIKFMREAGVKLWVLTGDKRETAENIGYSANLLDRNMDVVHVKGSTTEDVGRQLNDTLDRHISDENDNSSLVRNTSMASIARRFSVRGDRRKVSEKEVGIIIDGASLRFAIEDHSELFMALSDHAKVVICCRVTPLQKALVVRLVRKERQSMTLAIGDGGNDVSMIQEAHIGVGIFGKEGTQAARSADYAMGEFKHLLRLTVLHGRFSGVRTAGMINLSFYKNIFFTLTQVFFQLFDFVTGQTFNNQWVTSAFNVVVTAATPFLFGIFERDLEESTAVRFPSVYAANRDRKLFSLVTVIEYTVFYGLWHALVVFFGVYVFFGELRINFRDGKDSGLVLVGYASSTITVLMTLFKMLLHSHTLNWIVLLAVLLSVAVYAAVPSAAIAIVSEYPLEGVLEMLFTSPTFYLTAFLIFVASFILDYLILMGKKLFYPNVVDRLQMWEKEQKV